jgi:hypothetical protein
MGHFSQVESLLYEGTISAIDNDLVEIQLPVSFPKECELTAPGDSGSLWVTRDTGKAVALHKTGTAFGGTSARTARLSAVLVALNLRPLGIANKNSNTFVRVGVSPFDVIHAWVSMAEQITYRYLHDAENQVGTSTTVGMFPPLFCIA